MNYLMTKQAKVVAMTCTHAALRRGEFLRLGFQYDNLLMEESAQILEIETFIPMLLQVCRRLECLHCSTLTFGVSGKPRVMYLPCWSRPCQCHCIISQHVARVGSR